MEVNLEKFIKIINCPICLFLVYGCKSTEPNVVSNHDIEIHFQSWYSDTPVEVYLDNSLVLVDTVSTGSIIAIAKIIPMSISEGTHKLRVKASGNVKFEEVFEIRSTLYVGVTYESTQSIISFNFQNEKFFYD